MLYKLSKSVATGTTETAPDWTKMDISKGTIVQWILFMPEEAANLLHVTVEYHGVQILPFTRHQNIYGFFLPIGIPDLISVDDSPYVLDVRAWNEDDTYSHEYNLYVNIRPATPVKPDVEEAGFWEKMKGFIGVGE